MALYMYQAAYTGEFLGGAAQGSANRAELGGPRPVRGSRRKAGRRGTRFGEYDLVLVADMPNAESMAAIALAVGAGGAVRSAKTTALMSGTEGVAAMTKAASVGKAYKPAR